MDPQVVIFGGTHGNELTGSFLVNRFMRDKDFLVCKHFELQCLISNPKAVEACRRYIDHDLNRCFLPEDLEALGGFGPVATDAQVEGNALSHPVKLGYEFKRAREIVAQLGGEKKLEKAFLVDLHTTTSNMGPTIILTTLDPLNLWVAAYLSQEIVGLRVITNELPREKSPFINSLSPYGFCIEVGPVAQGALDPNVLKATLRILQLTLRALDCLADARFDFELAVAKSGLEKIPYEVVTFEYDRVLDYPKDEQGNLVACVHPERYGRDFIPVQKGSPLFIGVDEKEYFQEFEGIYWPIFIGESAYVEKGSAMVMTKRIVRSWKGETNASQI